MDTKVGYWTSQSCNLHVKLDLKGEVAIVHSIPDPEVEHGKVQSSVREDTKTFFRVDWTGPIDSVLANYADKCKDLGCDRDSYDDLCLCPISVMESQAFGTAPSRKDVLDDLYVGAFPPSQDESLVVMDLGDGVVMHSKDGRFSANSVFEIVDDNGVKRFRKNIRSVVTVGTSESLSLSFRNPPHMISIASLERRDAHYETDAGIDHYFVSFLKLRHLMIHCPRIISQQYLSAPRSTIQTRRPF